MLSGVGLAAEALEHCCPFDVEFRGTFSHLNCVLAFGVRQSEFRGWTCYCLQCRVRSCMRTMIDASRGLGSEIGSGGSWRLDVAVLLCEYSGKVPHVAIRVRFKKLCDRTDTDCRSHE